MNLEGYKLFVFNIIKLMNRSKSILKNDIGLSWIEDIQRQKYDKNLTSKIGFSDKPFIKKLELKRNFREKYNKIGQPEIWSGLKSKDLKFYKIGQL